MGLNQPQMSLVNGSYDHTGKISEELLRVVGMHLLLGRGKSKGDALKGKSGSSWRRKNCTPLLLCSFVGGFREVSKEAFPVLVHLLIFD